jgi:hypothetical protein
MKEQHVAMDIQVLETQGLLSQLAMHAGIHQQIPSYQDRLTSYHKTLLDFDKSEEGKDNIFHKSIAIDSMSVAKTLLQWRDYLAQCGWHSKIELNDCSRLNTLAKIDSKYKDNGLAQLLIKLQDQLNLMTSDKVTIPAVYKELVIEIPCSLDLLPDYIQPILQSLQGLGVTIDESDDDMNAMPESITEIHFTQQWKAEAWLSQQNPSTYNLWINTDNKRLDNWLHMSGQPVCGCDMENANPQITQMFLLAVQLFQRPLNVNTLLQYLYLPECPLNNELAWKMAKQIVREGGFCNEKVQKCIKAYIEREFKAEDDNTPQKETREQREENYMNYLPFDLRKEDGALPLSEESDMVDKKVLEDFLSAIKSHASSRAVTIAAKQPYDARITQLRVVSEMINALIEQIKNNIVGNLSFKMLIQWAQSLYEAGNYTLYNAQTHCHNLISQPSNMIGKADTAIWCDFYGDVSMALSTDFLSPYEQQQLKDHDIRLWDKEHESNLLNMMLVRPLHHTTKSLTVITCDKQGAAKLSLHPLHHLIQDVRQKKDGNKLYDELATKEIKAIDNHRDDDKMQICFDAKKHHVNWNETESFSSLEKLLQDPFDYFMMYSLQFQDISDTKIKMSTTYGYVAHETIEYLFTTERGVEKLSDFVVSHYEEALHRAFLRKGALLLLPEHHLDKERLTYQLRSCVRNLAHLIEKNNLSVIECEQKEVEQLDFEEDIFMKGYIDMVLQDTDGNKVVFDLKWTSKKNKFQTVLEKNRALQLAIYKAMLQKHAGKEAKIRTAYFVMPIGKLFSTEEFSGAYFERINPSTNDDVMVQLRLGYTERRHEINKGVIETADNWPLKELDYPKANGVFPLEDDDKKTNPKKAENKYSDYKCFTI